MGASASIGGDTITNQIEVLHELNLCIARKSWAPLTMLPNISDEQIKTLCDKFVKEDSSNVSSATASMKVDMIREIDALQDYLSKMKQGLLIPVVSESKTEAVECKQEENVKKQSTFSSDEEKKPKPLEVSSEEKTHFSVSLEFLIKFIKDHPQCEDMTTGQVVYNIIIPETKESRLTYVEDKLVDKYPQYYRRMKKW